MLLAHLSDLHLRDRDDLTAFGRQLDRIRGMGADHLAITGDILDRWEPRLLDGVLDALGERGFLDAERLTVLHGNHDLASSGGHPRRTADLWRLAFRFWDPPPLVARRRRRFYAVIERRAPGSAAAAPFVKTLASGVRLAVLDTVPTPWRPIRLSGRAITVLHAIGCLRRAQVASLHELRGEGPLVLLLHHYPLEVPAFRWTPAAPLSRIVREVRVPMAIPADVRAAFWDAAAAAGVSLVLCGHVHRARMDRHAGIAVGLNGQSGAEWAGRTIAAYDLSRAPLEQVRE